MRKIIALLIITMLGTLLIPEEAEAQRRRRYKPKYRKNRSISNYRGASGGTISNSAKYHVLSISINANNYFGDLAPVAEAASTDISFTRPGVGITYGYHFTPWLTARLGLTWVRLQGDDNVSADPSIYASLTRYTRNLSFRNDLFEFAGGFEIDLIPNYRGPYSRPPFTPFAFIGIAGFSSNPKGLAPETAPNGNSLSEAGTWVPLRPLGTEGQYVDGSGVDPYGRFNIAVPLGLGVKLALPGNLDVALEFGYRLLFTDYIDDVSGSYVDLGSLDSDLARAMSDRSTEAVAVLTNEQRDFQRIEEAGVGRLSSYVSEVNGERYAVIPGYGNAEQIRGNEDNDMYFITQIRISYLLSKGRGGARFR